MFTCLFILIMFAYVECNNDNFVCYLCLQNYPEYMHMPCGHYGICRNCKTILNKEGNQYKNDDARQRDVGKKNLIFNNRK